ncbi:hypothetical protein CPB84DRAFT_1828616 [Gymnopilus junonius]|uniref:Uncharacterized protein n=1 Tax=Gymnopilus junonius TaxID=109634 RepID=A0A9P5ND18_GYMJU|nr:hypothetical protein CPB84DRAFT_1829554 [Gymnopilus junonius]KAF8878361.1 hypothetical protein CPB84DRAFT_1828616 [Gymnopilus junonius]
MITSSVDSPSRVRVIVNGELEPGTLGAIYFAYLLPTVHPYVSFDGIAKREWKKEASLDGWMKAWAQESGVGTRFQSMMPPVIVFSSTVLLSLLTSCSLRVPWTFDI